MTRRRLLAGPAAPAEPCADVECLFCTLNDHLGKAHAFIRSAEYQMEQATRRKTCAAGATWSISSRLAKLAVRAAAKTSGEIEDRVRRRQGA